MRYLFYISFFAIIITTGVIRLSASLINLFSIIAMLTENMVVRIQNKKNKNAATAKKNFA